MSVAKYINAPKIEAKKFEKSEFPPTRDETHSLGIIPSPSAVPSNKPAIKTPAASRGIICFVKPQVSLNHSCDSPGVIIVRIVKPITAITNGIKGCAGNKKAVAITGIVASITYKGFILRIFIKE